MVLILLFRQFKYVDPNSKHYKYNMQLGIILKREHPGIIETKEGDIVIKPRPALDWSDYYDKDTLDDKGQIAADRVKQVFWASSKYMGVILKICIAHAYLT